MYSQNPQGQKDVNFQEFSYTTNPSYNQPYQYSQQGYQGGNTQQMVDSAVTFQSIRAAFTTGDIEGELPLLEELGINYSHIFTKGMIALNPFANVQGNVLEDSDLAGPIFFCFLFGIFLFLAGKAHFSYIYGAAALGWLSMYALLNLMSETGIDGYKVASVLGYSLLPIVLLSSLSIILHLKDTMGLLISVISVIWCSISASSVFAAHLSATDQRLLIAYPVGLVYGAFALLVVF